jgi:hypothetical protein
MLEILLGGLLRSSRRVRVGAGDGVWLSQISVAHRREATIQSHSVVHSDLFTRYPQCLSNSVPLALAIVTATLALASLVAAIFNTGSLNRLEGLRTANRQ